MTIRKITVPTFREDQVDKVYVNGQPTEELKPYKDIMKENIAAAIDAGMGAFGDDEIIMFVFIRQKNELKSVMGILGTPLSADEKVQIAVPSIDLPPSITLINEKE